MLCGFVGKWQTSKVKKVLRVMMYIVQMNVQPYFSMSGQYGGVFLSMFC